MSKKDAPPEEATPAPATKLVATFWSKAAKFRLGDIAQFAPFTPGANMGRLPDTPNRLTKPDDETEYQLYRGFFKTSDPALIANLEGRASKGGAIYLASKEEVPV